MDYRPSEGRPSQLGHARKLPPPPLSPSSAAVSPALSALSLATSEQGSLFASPSTFVSAEPYVPVNYPRGQDVQAAARAPSQADSYASSKSSPSSKKLPSPPLQVAPLPPSQPAGLPAAFRTPPHSPPLQGARAHLPASPPLWTAAPKLPAFTLSGALHKALSQGRKKLEHVVQLFEQTVGTASPAFVTGVGMPLPMVRASPASSVPNEELEQYSADLQALLLAAVRWQVEIKAWRFACQRAEAKVAADPFAIVRQHSADLYKLDYGRLSASSHGRSASHDTGPRSSGADSVRSSGSSNRFYSFRSTMSFGVRKLSSEAVGASERLPSNPPSPSSGRRVQRMSADSDHELGAGAQQPRPAFSRANLQPLLDDLAAMAQLDASLDALEHRVVHHISLLEYLVQIMYNEVFRSDAAAIKHERSWSPPASALRPWQTP